MPNSGAPSAPACPVCGAASRRERLLPAALLRRALEEFVEAPVPAGVALADYAMCRCVACTLEFADPPAPADDAFYEWLDHHGRYHVGARWEWDEVARLVTRGAAVLEIGAGDGRFLRRLRDEGGAHVLGIERSAAAAATLRAAGIAAATDAEATATLGPRTFDFVLAFHVVEHVIDPVGLLRQMRAWAGPAGRILFSVPYSPMYFETGWFDPLNHPPHHLSRWNAASLRELCARAGARARLSLPAPYSPLDRARYALAIRYLGPHWARRPRRARAQPLLHPLVFARELARQRVRERVAGRAAADVVLVEAVRDEAAGQEWGPRES